MDITEIYKQWVAANRDNILKDDSQFSRDKIIKAMNFAIKEERKRIYQEAVDLNKNVIAQYEYQLMTISDLFLILYKNQI